MLPAGAIVSDATTEIGLLAGSIAVGGFLAHVLPALKGKDEKAMRSATAVGGVGGLVFAALVNLGALFSL